MVMDRRPIWPRHAAERHSGDAPGAARFRRQHGEGRGGINWRHLTIRKTVMRVLFDFARERALMLHQ